MRTSCKNGRVRETTAKKTYNLPSRPVRRVQRILKAKTEIEAIVCSLEEVAFMDEVAQAVRATGGKLSGYRPLR